MRRSSVWLDPMSYLYLAGFIAAFFLVIWICRQIYFSRQEAQEQKERYAAQKQLEEQRIREEWYRKYRQPYPEPVRPSEPVKKKNYHIFPKILFLIVMLPFGIIALPFYGFLICFVLLDIYKYCQDQKGK